ncbi:porin [Duganella sp. FT3S]|uniref:Porin n=1 Tax=Rugamonas fusca TaxID=2758568 RepID=A0A7W2EJL8_9BURK|nr:porin [Rugamonas fusca]MBA5607121.1 porin [Rugamonas fusca]
MWGACHSALADSGVTAYGVIDTFATRIAADGLAPVTRVDASGLLASRLGLRGREELGGGLRSSFVLEAGLNGDDGSGADGNRLCNRQAWVGLGGPVGELRLGRQNTPQFYMNGKFDAFTSATQASGWNNMYGAPPRIDNAIGYFSPGLGGWTLQVLAARGATGGAAPLAETAANRNLQLAAEYERPGFYLGANYQQVDNAALPYRARRASVGASWTYTPRWTVFGAAGSERRSDGSQRSMLYSLSVRWRADGPLALSFGWAGLRDRLAGAGHGDAAELGAQAQYRLSVRTSLYGALARLRQYDQRNSFALVGAAVVTPAAQIRSPVPGGAIDGVQLGVLHTF